MTLDIIKLGAMCSFRSYWPDEIRQYYLLPNPSFKIFAEVAYPYFYSICSFHLKKKGGKGYLLQRMFHRSALGDASAEVSSRGATASHHMEK